LRVLAVEVFNAVQQRSSALCIGKEILFLGKYWPLEKGKEWKSMILWRLFSVSQSYCFWFFFKKEQPI
jgi:hypothetical protein